MQIVTLPRQDKEILCLFRHPFLTDCATFLVSETFMNHTMQSLKSNQLYRDTASQILKNQVSDVVIYLALSQDIVWLTTSNLLGD